MPFVHRRLVLTCLCVGAQTLSGSSLQEVKLTRKDITDELASVPGYSAYFCLPRKNVGYSGVATYCCTDCTPARAGASPTPPAEHTRCRGCA